jgi:ABC-2 type transport system ATP-binding protein
LASTLLHDPPVLVLDEPTTGLDPGQIRETRNLIRELATERTVLVSSHILPEVERTCDRVIIIARGRIRADGTPGDLLARLREAAPYIVEAGRARTGSGGQPYPDRVFGAVPGVQAVDPDPEPDTRADGWRRLILSPRPGAPDLREAISNAAAAAGVPLRELHRRRPTLEQFFMSVIEEDPTPPTHRSEPRPGTADPEPAPK